MALTPKNELTREEKRAKQENAQQDEGKQSSWDYEAGSGLLHRVLREWIENECAF